MPEVPLSERVVGAVLDAAALSGLALSLGRLGSLAGRDLGPTLSVPVALCAAAPFVAVAWTDDRRTRGLSSVLRAALTVAVAATVSIALIELSNAAAQRARAPLVAAGCSAYALALAPLLRALLGRAWDRGHSDGARSRRGRPGPLALTLAGVLVVAVAGLLLHRSGVRDEVALHPAARLNLVLITIDTLRADALGCYGQVRATSPHLDALAAAGTRLARATSQAPHTHGSMASLLTAKYPLAHRSVNGQPALSAAHETLAEHLAGLGYRTAGFLDNPWLTPEFGFTRGYEHYEPRSTNEAVLPWLAAHGQERFFLHVHHLHPHGPYEPEAPWIDEWSPGYSGPWLRVEGELLERCERPGVAAEAGVDRERCLALYHAEVRRADAEVGALLAALSAAGLAEDTLVVFAADHGEEFLDHGALHHSHTLYEELVHVPVILRLPGSVPAGKTLAAPLELVDVAPTALDLMGLPPMIEAQGASFSAALRGADAAPRVCVAQRYNRVGRHLLSANDGRWKLHIQLARTGPLPMVDWSPTQPPRRDWLRANRYALFDLEADPGEGHDLARREPLVVARLTEALAAWRERNDPGTPFGPGVTDQTLRVSREARARLTALGYAGDLDNDR